MTAGRRRRVHAALAVALSTLAALAGVEAGFRVRACVAPEPRWLEEDRYPSNPRGYFRPCGDGTFCPNRERDAVHGCAAPVEPEKGQVLFVGDSFTFGQGVDAADAWPSLIDFPRDQRRNCAVSGHEVDDAQADVARLAAQYHPRLVVYGMVLNDFGLETRDPDFASVRGAQFIDDFMNFRTQNLERYARRERAPVRFALTWSEAARWFYRRRVLARVSRLTLDGYRRAFAGERGAAGYACIRDMAQRSPRFLVVLFPLFVSLDRYPLEDVHRAIREELARAHIEVLDLLDVFRGRDAARLIVYPTDQHPNEDAHRLAAAAVRERLRRLGWPPFDR